MQDFFIVLANKMNNELYAIKADFLLAMNFYLK